MSKTEKTNILMADGGGASVETMASSDQTSGASQTTVESQCWDVGNGPDRKENVNACDQFGNSFLVRTIWNIGSIKRSQVLKKLLSEPMCDINQVNNDKNSPLHIACLVDDTRTITLLLKSKRLTTLNAQNKKGETPIMLAITHGHTKAEETLISQTKKIGLVLDMRTTNNKGENVFQVCQKLDIRYILQQAIYEEQVVMQRITTGIKTREGSPIGSRPFRCNSTPRQKLQFR